MYVHIIPVGLDFLDFMSLTLLTDSFVSRMWKVLDRDVSTAIDGSAMGRLMNTTAVAVETLRFKRTLFYLSNIQLEQP